MCRVRVLLQGPAETREDLLFFKLFFYLFFPVGPSRETPGNLSQLFKGAIIQIPGDGGSTNCLSESGDAIALRVGAVVIHSDVPADGFVCPHQPPSTEPHDVALCKYDNK